MKFSARDANMALNYIGFDMNNRNFSIDDVRRGMNVELEHGLTNSTTNVTNNDIIMTLKIALVHLLEDGNYYDKLKLIEGGSSLTIQSALFNKKYYTEEKANNFLEKVCLDPIKKVHETDRYYRYRIAEPDENRSYYTVPIKRGVKFIMMK